MTKIKKAFREYAAAWHMITQKSRIALKDIEINKNILTWHSGRVSIDYIVSISDEKIYFTPADI